MRRFEGRLGTTRAPANASVSLRVVVVRLALAHSSLRGLWARLVGAANTYQWRHLSMAREVLTPTAILVP